MSQTQNFTYKEETNIPLDQMVLHKNNLFLANYKPRKKKISGGKIGFKASGTIWI